MKHVSGAAQLGIRGLGSSSRSDFEDARKAGNLILSPREIRARGLKDVIASLPNADRYYVTIDIDGMDASIAPGTGTPEIGGMTTREALRMLRGLRGLNYVGGDVVEVSPPFDTSGNTAIVGATLAFEILCLLAEARAEEVHLVLSSVSSLSALKKTAEKFARVGTTSLLLTKLDEATALGNLLPLLTDCQLPLSYVTHGQNVPDDIAAAAPSELAGVILNQDDPQTM